MSKLVNGLTVAEAKEVADWAGELPDSYLLCRDIGHLWRPFKARWDDDNNSYVRILRCGRCKTEREQGISAAGVVLWSQYDYADGYQAPKGTGRLDGEGRGALRLESVLRLIGKDER